MCSAKQMLVSAKIVPATVRQALFLTSALNARQNILSVVDYRELGLELANPQISYRRGEKKTKTTALIQKPHFSPSVVQRR